MEKKKVKSAMARKNEGNDLFFRVLHNILTDKSIDLYKSHLEDPTFEDVYTNVGVEKALEKCYDDKILKALINCQMEYAKIVEKEYHYWYLLKRLPITYKFIDWKLKI